MDEKHEHLRQAYRYIAEAEAHIARQKQMIAELERDGHETDLAISTLRALEQSLHTFEQLRELILGRLKLPD